jgi:hypothetical protein
MQLGVTTAETTRISVPLFIPSLNALIAPLLPEIPRTSVNSDCDDANADRSDSISQINSYCVLVPRSYHPPTNRRFIFEIFWHRNTFPLGGFQGPSEPRCGKIHQTHPAPIPTWQLSSPPLLFSSRSSRLSSILRSIF